MKWFNNLSVMTKLVSSFIVIALFSGLVGLIGMSNIKSISDADMMLYQRATISIIHVGDAAMLYERMRVNLREIFMYRDKENVEKRRKTIDEIPGVKPVPPPPAPVVKDTAPAVDKPLTVGFLLPAGSGWMPLDSSAGIAWR